jgi:hypothetical protein
MKDQFVPNSIWTRMKYGNRLDYTAGGTAQMLPTTMNRRQEAFIPGLQLRKHDDFDKSAGLSILRIFC